MHAPGDVRVEERDDPKIIDPTDAVIRLTATCICGSDLWPYRGVEPLDGADADGARVRRRRRGGRRRGADLKVGDFVVGSFVISDNTCEICRAGYQSKCVHGQFVAGTIGTQAERARIPLRRRHAGGHPGAAGPGADPVAAGRLRRARHRLVRRRRRRGRPGQDRRGRRRRRGRPDGGPRRQAARRGADHRHVPARRTGRRWPANSAPRTSSRSAATTAWPGSRS